MRSNENKERCRKLIEEGFGRGDLSIVDKVVAADFTEHQRGIKPGVPGVREAIRTLHSWFADFDLRVDDLVAAGNTVWARNTASGLNTGSVMGMPPTGKPMTITVFDVARFENGLIVEHWGVADQLGMLLQLGLVGSHEAARAAIGRGPSRRD